MNREQLQRVGLGAEASPIEGATYLAALAHYDDRYEFELFIDAVTHCATSQKALSRSHGNALDRTAKKIYTIRLYAAAVAEETARTVVADWGGRQGRRGEGNTIRNVQMQVAKHFEDRFPAYSDYHNFKRFVWNPSKPVLHLGVALDLCALKGRQEPILPLMRRAAEWLPRAVSNAQYQAAILRKRFDDLGELVELDAGEQSVLAEHITRSRPEQMYRRTGNAEWKALDD